MSHVIERYSRATSSSRLVVDDRPGDADVLIAAGWAGRDISPIALTLWRMKHSGRPQGFHGVVSELNDWLRVEAPKKRVRDAGAKTKMLVEKTVYWWLNNTCKHCEGRGHPNFAETPVMDESIDCPECLGEGVVPLATLIHPSHLEAANMVVGQIERISADVFFNMQVALKG